jgi:hypothetical protein
VGEAVIAHLEELPSLSHIQQMRGMPTVGDIIPCGSRGIAWELHVLETETGLRTKLEIDLELAQIWGSAGPATYVVVTSREPLTGSDGLIMKLESLLRS